MAQYRVRERSFFQGRGIVEPGEIVEWDGQPGSNLEPVDPEPQPAAAQPRKAKPARRPHRS